MSIYIVQLSQVSNASSMVHHSASTYQPNFISIGSSITELWCHCNFQDGGR